MFPTRTTAPPPVTAASPRVALAFAAVAQAAELAASAPADPMRVGVFRAVLARLEAELQPAAGARPHRSGLIVVAR